MSLLFQTKLKNYNNNHNRKYTKKIYSKLLTITKEFFVKKKKTPRLEFKWVKNSNKNQIKIETKQQQKNKV